MASTLPPFEAVSIYELRRLYANHKEPDIRRLILEIQRYREVLKEAEDLAASIEESWHESVGGSLVAIYWLRQIFRREKFRAPGP